MNREMRRLMEREERIQKGDPNGQKRRVPGAAQKGPGGVAERRSIWNRLVTFLHEVRQELRKVNWPSREQMVIFTIVTLITTTVLTMVIFGLDVAMKEAVLTLLEQA